VVEARRADERGQSLSILIGVSGHGLLDMAAYQAYQEGTLLDLTATDEEIAEALARLPEQPDKLG
jgi:tryptophan synthase beta chain